MIQEFVDRFMAKKGEIRATFAAKHPEDYKAIVTAIIKAIHDNHKTPDPERIHEIDDGDYQGTLVYVIGADDYQPSRYWFVKVGYGSCSGCDTLEAIRDYDNEPPSAQQLDDYMTLALHIVQGLKEMGDGYHDVV